MYKPLSLFLGLRYVRSRHGNGFSSFISASSTIGIALGVMVLIIVLSAMNGFEKVLAQRLLSLVPHAELVTVSAPIVDWRKQVEKIQQHPNVEHAAPVIKITGMMQKGSELKGVEVRGVDLNLEQQVSDITRYLVAGTWMELAKQNAVILGAGVAKKLNVSIGDKLQLLHPKNDLASNQRRSVNQRFPALAKQNVVVVGIFQFGGTIDDGLVYTSLEYAQDMNNYSLDAVQGIRLKVDDVFQAPYVVRQVAREFDYHAYILDWTRTQGHVYNDIQLVRLVMFVVLVLVIAVASFNIVSTLIMAVNEKKSDIAILKTMGASRLTIMSTFMFQGVVNGVLGCMFGAMLGVYFANNLTSILANIESLIGSKVLSADVYFIDYVPSELHMNDVYFTLITALSLSLIATIYPAWRATKIEPAEVLGQQ